MFRLFRKDTRPRIFFRDHNSILKNVIPLFNSVKPEKAQAFVLWADSMGPSREFAEYGKKLKKPVIVVEHGRGSIREYLPPLNYPSIADKICVWGPADRDMMIEAGFDPKRIVLTGAPIFDGVSTERVPHEGVNVLFAPTHWDEEISENHDIYNKLASIRGINVISKILKKYHDPSKYGKNVIITSQKDGNMLETIFSLMKKIDIVVTNTAGTLDLIAMYFNIPVIYVDNFKPRAFLDTDEKTIAKFIDKHGPPKAVDYTRDLNDLPALIKENIENPNKRLEERRKELYNVASIGLINDPVKRIVDVIKGEISAYKT